MKIMLFIFIVLFIVHGIDVERKLTEIIALLRKEVEDKGEMSL